MNQGASNELTLTVNEVVPVMVDPEAGVNEKVALVPSRVGEVATNSTSKPLDVTLVICTLPASIVGAEAGIVSVEVVVCVPTVSARVTVPATVPGSMPGRLTLEANAGNCIVSLAVLLSAKVASLYPEGSPTVAELGAKERFSVPP